MKQLTLADELFLLGQDEKSGRSAISEISLATGLAGGLLGELLLGGMIQLQDGRVAPLRQRPPADSVTHAVLERIVAERRLLTIQTWLSYIRQDAYPAVARRLAFTGVVTSVRTTGWLRRTQVRYPVVDLGVAARPRMRLRAMLAGERPWDPSSVLLALLVRAVGLEEVLALELTARQIRERLDQVAQSAPPPFVELSREVEQAIASPSVGHRRQH